MTKQLPIKKKAILPRIDGIENNLEILRTLATLPEKEFLDTPAQDRAHHNLRLALEGVFNITAHILSRIPGGRETEYKRMARKLGEKGIIDSEFASGPLVKMAGYRNRLTHFYAEVRPKEIYGIIRNNLSDIETFLSAMKKLLEHPKKFGLTIE